MTNGGAKRSVHRPLVVGSRGALVAAVGWKSQ
jgi:hypothetical protein